MRISLLVLVIVVAGSPAAGRVVHQEQSLYQTVLVTDEGQRRCLQFSLRRDQRNQSCMRLNDPYRLILTYTQMTLTALLLVPEPQRVLIVGLGGGSLPMVLSRLYPDAYIDIVEIDPVVVDIAERFFSFTPTGRVRVFQQDARVFGKRAGLRQVRYDLIVLDAFNAEYIPEHLMTREYLLETRALLADGGVLASNTFASSKLYDYESVTYESVFNKYINFTMPDSSNRIILAVRGRLPDSAMIAARADALRDRLIPYGVRVDRYLPRLTVNRDWDSTVAPLTDQYAPANLLRGIER